jgi:hypothetical protein
MQLAHINCVSPECFIVNLNYSMPNSVQFVSEASCKGTKRSIQSARIKELRFKWAACELINAMHFPPSNASELLPLARKILYEVAHKRARGTKPVYYR